jgi:hypothetical protein
MLLDPHDDQAGIRQATRHLLASRSETDHDDVDFLRVLVAHVEPPMHAM